MHAGEGIFVSNRAFLCRTGLFCVEPSILLSNRAFFVSNECYNYLIFRVIKGFKHGYPCIVEIRGS